MKLDTTSRASSRVLDCALPRQTHWHLSAWTGQTCGRARHRRSALPLAAVIRWSRPKGGYYPDPVIGQDPASDERSQAGAALRLRPLRLADEAAFHRAHEVMAAEGFTFGFDYEPSAAWSTYLKSMDDHRRAVNVPGGWVPETFLVADVAGAIVGRTSIRHELNEPFSSGLCLADLQNVNALGGCLARQGSSEACGGCA